MGVSSCCSMAIRETTTKKSRWNRSTRIKTRSQPLSCSRERFPFFIALLVIIATTIVVNGYTQSPKPPFIRRDDLIGIWKLTNADLHSSTEQQSTKDTSEKEDVSGIRKSEKEEEDMAEIVLRLNEDGTFDPYTTKPVAGDPPMHQILGRGGVWKYQNEALILAGNRPQEGDYCWNIENGKNDTVFCGKLQVHTSRALPTPEADQQNVIGEDADNLVDGKDTDEVLRDHQLSIPKGEILIGKYMYPMKHNAFFEEPMLFRQSNVGKFAISQLLGNLNTRLQHEKDEETLAEEQRQKAKFHKSDLYGRKFYLSSSPHKVNPTYAARDKYYKEDEARHDIRVIPIEFHKNNTFSAVGVEKILRGRYGMTGPNRDRLWFQVSLFGAGRSAPGSVYSEGRLLSHDDRRGYLGNIQTLNTTTSRGVNVTQFFIEGEIYFGTDLKTPKKPNSMGHFSMQEIRIDEGDDNDDDEMEDNENDRGDEDKDICDRGDDFDTNLEMSDDAFQ